MGVGKKQKTVSLTDETWAMVQRKTESTNNWTLSAWIRGQIRMMDEGVDVIQMDLMVEYYKKRLNCLCFAMDELLDKPMMQALHEKASQISKQASLEDFA
jgi:hypothetical protein